MSTRPTKVIQRKACCTGIRLTIRGAVFAKSASVLITDAYVKALFQGI
jgi:hypothetical protein